METGIQRKLDELGRIVLPIEIRRTLGIAAGDRISMSVCKDKIILQKYAEYDFFDGSTENLIDYKGKKVSRETIAKLAELASVLSDEIEASAQ